MDFAGLLDAVEHLSSERPRLSPGQMGHVGVGKFLPEDPVEQALAGRRKALSDQCRQTGPIVVIRRLIRAPRGVQELLIEADAGRFFRPPYVGHKGWIGVRLDGRIDRDELNALVRRSYRMTAPKKLVASGAGMDR